MVGVRYAPDMAEPKRIRSKRNLTLNPDGVRKLLEAGAARSVAETNLSRLVDDAIAEYVERHGGAGPTGSVAEAAPVRRTAASKVQKLAPPPGKPLSAAARRTMREFDQRKRK